MIYSRVVDLMFLFNKGSEEPQERPNKLDEGSQEE